MADEKPLLLPTEEPAPMEYKSAHAGRHILSLDGLRAISILIVFLSHCGYDNRIPGKLGVMVFFVISGYLITTLMLREARETGTISLRNFYLRRFWRIIPPLYITVGVILLIHLSGLNPAPILWPHVVAGLAFLGNYSGVLNIPNMHDLLPLWSLGVEEHFYLLFPLVYLLWLRKRTPAVQATVLLGACAAVLIWRCYQVYALHILDESSSAWIRTDNAVDGILFGCVLAVAANPADEAAHRFKLPSWSWLVGVAGLLFCVLFRDPGFRNSIRFSIEGLSIMPILYCSVKAADQWPFKLLNWKPIVVIGVGSYICYLIHMATIDAIGVHHPWPNIKFVPVAMAAIGLYAYLGYRLIERPCAEIRRKLSRA